MQMSPELVALIGEIKYFAVIGAAYWSFFNAYNWVKGSLTTTQEGVKDIKAELHDQTTALVKATGDNTVELREMRKDVGRMVESMMAPPNRAARAARRKK